ncbi:hypothetical protein M3197_15835 [Sporosarcina aquimarina]|uniref:hypothetical protein n=1 Tax=Sporosarcina aquimarina TaxID=114975 RepID=UPI00203F628A|nr:hypothetical protein [Sporosarcina aquimarina]MCM3758911.1 hypothetical protein [Sporosarcina aquimarina]
MNIPFSMGSIVFIVFGSLAMVINWTTTGIIEPIVLLGFILLLVGILFSFIAFLKKEKGITKIISGVSFFIILFCLVWFEPLMFVYILTWLKNIF